MATTFGSRLKELRTEFGIRQEDLADQMGVTKGTVSKWERDIRKPDFGMMERLSDLFQVKLGYLMGEDVAREVIQPTDEELCEWVMSDDDVTLTNFAARMAQLSDETRSIVFATINAAYTHDKEAGLLNPKQAHSVVIRHKK